MSINDANGNLHSDTDGRFTEKSGTRPAGALRPPADDAAPATVYDGAGLERDRIATFTDGTEVVEGEAIRYRQAAGGLLAPSGQWRHGVAAKRPTSPDELARMTRYNTAQGYVALDPDELYLRDGEQYFNIVGQEVEPDTGLSSLIEDDRHELVIAYLEAALFSETGDDGEPLDRQYGINDIAPETRAQVEADIDSFLKSNRKLIDTARAATGYGDWSQVGHDLLLTRNGHGAGFWDRGIGATGEELSEMVRPMGNQNFYVGDDGLIHAN